MTEIVIDNDIYKSVPEQYQKGCLGCVACNNSDLCYAIRNAIRYTHTYTCRGTIWIKKEENMQDTKETTEEKRYTVEQILEAIENVEGSLLWSYNKEIHSWLERHDSPEYQQYLELKKKFEG